jgi:membrane protease YdiL (CAAX protease family)
MKGWQRVLILIIPYFFVVGTFQWIGAFVADVNLFSEATDYNYSSYQNFVISLFTFVGTLLIIWIFRKFVDKSSFVSMGFAIKNRVTDILAGILIGLCVMLLGLGILVYFEELEVIGFSYNSLDLLYAVLLFVLVSLNEELLMRGYVLNNFINSFNKYIALIISALLFSLMHAGNPNMDWFSYTSLFLAGILLGATYIYTKNLWFPVALHFSWNFFQTILGFKVSGQQTYSILHLKIKQNNRWNGGDFGFEGSYLSLVAEVLLIIGVFYYYYKKHKAAL